MSHGTFEQVVDARCDEQLVIDLVAMDECLVGVDYLFEVERLINVMGERGVVVEVLVSCYDGIDVGLGVHHLRSKDATGEVTSVGNEVDTGIE